MASRSSHNKNNSAVKRILQEAKELGSDPSTDYCAGPLEDDIFEWHATIRGPGDTDYEGGLYHCRVLLPSEYPFKPPNIMLLTPNGRFELNKKICISFTAYHEDLWQPAWGVRTAIVGLQGFFPIKGEAAMGIGALDYPAAERKRLATLSREWVCPDCGVPNKELLPEPPANPSNREEGSNAASNEHGRHSHAMVLAPVPSTGAAGPSQPESVPPTPATAMVAPAIPEPPAPVPTSVVASATSVGIAIQTVVPAAQAQLPPTQAPAPPAPALASLVSDRPAPSRSQSSAVVRLASLPSRPPLFLDGLIVALVAIMAYILAKKVGVQQAIIAML